MDCLLCHTMMQNEFGSKGAEDFSKGPPYYLYRCLSCDTLCKDELAMHTGQTWLFANGSSLYFSDEAVSDPGFMRRFASL